jgi:hypothetical protein
MLPLVPWTGSTPNNIWSLPVPTGPARVGTTSVSVAFLLRPALHAVKVIFNGNPPLEPRGLEVEFFPKEEVLHEKVKIYG